MHSTWAAWACVLLTAVSGHASDVPVPKAGDLQAPKEPAYISKRPLYGVLVFGPEARTPIWMVLDRSQPAAELYDVLYVDLNANGDLTEPAERLAGQVQGTEVRFLLRDLKDPATGAIHTQFTARVSGGADPTVMVSLRWRNRLKMGGGYPQDPEDGYLKFGDATAHAPVMRPDGDGRFRFQRWYSGRLTIGGADDFMVFVGQPGTGANSFWAFQEHFLPESEGVQATLVYRDAEDKERRAMCLLKERC
jgi:hypothetical protein